MPVPAAIQAPVILMSRNRHANRDRLDAEHDYEVNLKAELEIMRRHQKLDELREKPWNQLVATRQDQPLRPGQFIGGSANRQ